MTWSNTLALWGAMVVLAAIPGVSVVVVTTRSATLGFVHGAGAALGIVVGDLLFIGLALGGWSLFVEALGPWVAGARYLAGAYLIGLGIQFCRSSTPRTVPAVAALHPSLGSSFLAGLAITLGDQKATLFYLGFLPAFVDMATLSALDVTIILATATVAVGGVKLIYAALATRASMWLGRRLPRQMRAIAGGIVIAAGLVVIIQR